MAHKPNPVTYMEGLLDAIDPGLPVHHPSFAGRYDQHHLARGINGPAVAPSFPQLDSLRTVDELAALQGATEREMAALDSEYEGKPMPATVREAWDSAKALHSEISSRVADLEERKATLAAMSKQERHVEAPNVVVRKSVEDIYNPDTIAGLGFRSVEQRNQVIKDNALRSIESSHLPKSAQVDNLTHFLEFRDNPDEQGSPEIARRILLTGSPAYRSGFAKYLKHGNTQAFTAEENRAAALAVVGTTTTGGYAVPYIFDPTIINIGAYTAQNPFRAACRVESISGGNNWRAVTVGAVTSAYVAEPTAATEQGPTFGQPTYTVQRAHAFVTVSMETLQDRPDMSEELTSVFAESKATYEENQFAVGVGTTVFPMGMFTATAYTAVNTATNDVTALADTQLVEAALPLRFRANGQWFMNRSTIRQLQALDTGWRYFSGAGIQYPGNANPQIPPSTGNTGLSLLGYPVWEVPSAVATLTTDQALIAALVDPRTYIIVDRIGMNVEVIPNMLNGATPSFPTGERGIYCYWRNTAKPLIADGGRVLRVQ